MVRVASAMSAQRTQSNLQDSCSAIGRREHGAAAAISYSRNGGEPATALDTS